MSTNVERVRYPFGLPSALTQRAISHTAGTTYLHLVNSHICLMFALLVVEMWYRFFITFRYS